MAKYGKKYTMKKGFADYNYMIVGTAGVGKTELAYTLGKLASSNDEGTFLITCGKEPVPEHLDGVYGEVARTANDFVDIVKDLCENKQDFPNTKFIAIDSCDEFVRIFENYTVAEWNSKCKLEEKAKSISQAYKGFQKGENRCLYLMLDQIGKLLDAGYKLLLIAHSKIKTINDIYSGVSYEQIACSLDNKYYSALKDKVNLIGTCYFENVFEDVHKEKNAFTKKNVDKGKIIGQRRICIFKSDDLSIDTKSHFSEIVPKIPLNAKAFVSAVEDALKAQQEARERRLNGEEDIIENRVESEPEQEEDIVIEDEVIEDIVEDTPELEADVVVFDDEDTLRDELKIAIKEIQDVDIKKKVAEVIKGYGKFNDVNLEGLKKIKEIIN